MEDLYKYVTAKYTHKVIQSQEDSFFKDELLLNRRGRNLAADKLGPSNAHLGHHASTLATYLHTAYNIYNEIPNMITLVDEKIRFKSVFKKSYLGKLDPLKIQPKPRNNPILPPYIPVIDNDCNYQNIPQNESSSSN